jgi:hypothetical protein
MASRDVTFARSVAQSVEPAAYAAAVRTRAGGLRRLRMGTALYRRDAAARRLSAEEAKCYKTVVLSPSPVVLRKKDRHDPDARAAAR